MSWLRDILHRRPSPPTTLSTSYGETLRRLAATEDAAERGRLAALLATQLEGAFSGSANNVQVALWQVEERIRERIGETNDMISEAAALIREGGTAVSALRGEFHEAIEHLDDWRQDMSAWRQSVDTELASFRRSRDESIAERRELREQYQESKDDRAVLREQLKELSAQVEQLSGQIAQVLSERHAGQNGG